MRKLTLLARPVSGGRLIGLLGATFFGITAPLTRLALDGGSNPITVVGFRFLICVLAMSAAIKLLGQGYTLPPRTRWRTLGISLVWPLGPLGYVSSIFFMPVSLAVLILYTYPLMVAAASPFMEGGKFGRARICAFLLAFTGLAIALGPTAHDLDWRGMVFALILLLGGFFVRNPSMVGAKLRAEEAVSLATGVTRITRHPGQWAIIIWALGHIVVNGDLVSIVFFSSFAILSFIGSFLIDKKKAQAFGHAWLTYASVTSNVPFLAVVRGRTRLKLSELRLPVVIGLVAYALLWYLHESYTGTVVF